MLAGPLTGQLQQSLIGRKKRLTNFVKSYSRILTIAEGLMEELKAPPRDHWAACVLCLASFVCLLLSFTCRVLNDFKGIKEERLSKASYEHCI